MHFSTSTFKVPYLHQFPAVVLFGMNLVSNITTKATKSTKSKAQLELFGANLMLIQSGDFFVRLTLKPPDLIQTLYVRNLIL